jgi:hypothetical protein
MKIIRNKILPPKGFAAMSFLWFIFTRKESLSERIIRHETIHYLQQKELLFLFQWLWYGIEWLVRILQYKLNRDAAYRNISFEREAYANDINESYLSERKKYSFLKYLRNGK